ncbi:MAG: autotransporter outer membrane beta-barrel domain-containing protein [Beijerinckiaceae bacterium]
MKDAPQPVVQQPRWSVWATGFGGSGRLAGSQLAGTSNVSSGVLGVASGFDYRLSPDTKIGLAFAGGGLNWGMGQVSGSGRSDFFQAGLYATTKFGPAYLSGALAFANHWVTTSRIAAFGDQLRGSYSAQTYAGRIEGGYRFASPVGGLTPYGALQAQRLRTPGYTETDLSFGGFGLTYNAQGATSTRSELGLRYDLSIPVALRARGAWAHDWTTAPGVSAAFQTLPGSNFLTSGAKLAPNLALISTGIDLQLANGFSFFGKFDSEMSSRAQIYAGSGGIRYRW